jgi:hypothetical protein
MARTFRFGYGGSSYVGYAKEIISPEVGILPSNDDEWTEAIREGYKRIKPEACLELAMKKFHYLKMCENYEVLYRKICTGENLNPYPPRSIGWSQERALS